jgi:hypothetical protein
MFFRKDCWLLTIQQDLSDKVILEGAHYIAIGEHADLWEGRMSDRKVRYLSFVIMKYVVDGAVGCGQSASRWIIEHSRLSTKI